ncbi:MAG TPA: cytochrome c3 family protein [Nitrospirota bacterium]|nr:cytochrome c3 family protein [Nitrospirota bacterium]
MRSVVLLCAAIMLCLVPVVAFAAGAHDGLECTGCHALHTAKDGSLIFAVDANKKDINPRTKQPYGGITALCLGCHDTPEKGGQGIKPVDSHTSHPYGLTSVNAKVARVPAEFLKDGKFECTSCHDPHPSNTNYKYLRVDTANGSKMDVFCAACHPMKADPKSAAASKTTLFNSMDENLYKASGSEAPASATPAGRKKQQQ